MELSFNRPTDIACTLDGTATWLSDDAGAALVDGAPNVKSRLSWITGAQTTTSETVITATWGTAIVPRVAALIGVSLPVGLKVTIDFQDAGLFGYNSVTTAVIAMDNGTNGVWVVLPEGLDAVTGVKFHLVNDVAGATVMAAGDAVDIGELWIGSSPTYQVTRNVKDDLVDPSIRNRTLGQQVYTTKRLPYRSMSFDMIRVSDDDVDTSRVLRASTAQSIPSVLILQDTHLSAAMFGNITGFSLSTLSDGCYWQPSVNFEEVPNG